jgi:AbrB family looped-hinge helix DNA binding protein
MEQVSLRRLFYGAVTIGERGQVVVPAEARKDCRIEPGDKLLVFGHPMGGGLFLTKVEHVQEFLAEIQQQIAAAGEHVDEAGGK